MRVTASVFNCSRRSFNNVLAPDLIQQMLAVEAASNSKGIKTDEVFHADDIQYQYTLLFIPFPKRSETFMGL